ncbi:MAG: hypothetical protein VYA30_04680 [Myxococcota bacterium]|nr:hypothetical protein [Myxococcota bacterium]
MKSLTLSLARPGQNWRYLSIFVILLAVWTSGCSEGSCQFESDCAQGQSCLEGLCVYVCSENTDCQAGYACVAGRCEIDNSETGCTGSECVDAARELDMSIEPVDLAIVDSSIPDFAFELDGDTTGADEGVNSTPDTSFVEPDFAQQQPDSGVVSRGFDLTGLYTVTSTVLVTTGGEFEEGQELRTIVSLTRLQGTRYRLEVYNLDGVRQYLIPAVDFIAPGGAGRYQFEYTRREPFRNNCDQVEVRFERGRYSSATHGFQLTGAEERAFSIVGDSCSGGYIVRTDSVWIPLP